MEKNLNRQAQKKAIINKINSFLTAYFKLIIVFISLTIFLAGFFILLIPKYKKAISQVEIAKNNMETEYAEFSRYLNRLETLNSAYRSVDKREVDRINSLLPDTPELENLMSQVEAIAKNSGALLVSLGIEDVSGSAKSAANKSGAKKISASPDGLNKVKLTANLVGLDYAGFKGLLKVIESNLRLLDIERVSFTPKGNAISLEMTSYYYRQ